jgi:Putative peptidoglycan binding domain/Transglycosylase SLT domain
MPTVVEIPMPTPGVDGRSAWTVRGFPDGFSKMYRRHLIGRPTGGNPEYSQDYWAVASGVLAIQRLVNGVTQFWNGSGWTPVDVTLDYSSGPGIFGPATERAVKAYQAIAVKPADGIAGPNTCKSLLHQPVNSAESQHGIPRHLLWGVIAQESAYDPGAVGFSTPYDLGLVQINTKVHPVNPRDAFDPYFALEWAGTRMAQKSAAYRLKQPEELAWNLAALAHHAPGWADYWAKYGSPPPAYATRAQDYINRVLAAAGKW